LAVVSRCSPSEFWVEFETFQRQRNGRLCQSVKRSKFRAPTFSEIIVEHTYTLTARFYRHRFLSQPILNKVEIVFELRSISIPRSDSGTAETSQSKGPEVSADCKKKDRKLLNAVWRIGGTVGASIGMGVNTTAVNVGVDVTALGAPMVKVGLAFNATTPVGVVLCLGGIVVSAGVKELRKVARQAKVEAARAEAARMAQQQAGETVDKNAIDID
jgi:hypothetical protein